MSRRTSIAIFGASATQQVNGYAPYLAGYFAEDVHIFGHGGMHLNNAGICFIDRVLAKRPAYCFVDWFSTGYLEVSSRTAECIDTILYRFGQADCRPVFLFLPRGDKEARAPFEEFCRKHLESRGAFYIDVGESIGDLSSLLRDTVHTTDYGSRKYAEVIHSRFVKDRQSLASPQTPHTPRYATVRSLRVNKSFDNELLIVGQAEIIGFLLTIGPHSGIIEVVDRNETTRVNTWDQWCHYRRQHFNIAFSIDGTTRLRILQDRFDTSASRRPYDYDSVRKELSVHAVYYCGTNLRVLNKSAGRRLEHPSRVRGIARATTDAVGTGAKRSVGRVRDRIRRSRPPGEP